VHVLDCATLETERDPVKDFDVIEEELKLYGGLSDRPRIIALNKIDLPDGKAMADMVQPLLEERGYPVFQVSAASREGMQELIYAMAQIVQKVRKEQKAEETTRIVLRPVAVDDKGFKVIANADGTFNVIGDKPQRWVKQTDFANAEAIGYLADRLASYGVEKELFKAGAKAGDEVRIGIGDDAVIFDWEPSIEAGAELLAGPRGEDLRLSTPWRMDLNDDVDQLSDDEIEMQWEYNIANPRDPRVDEDAK
jgi:GTP-binding protein